MDGGDEVEMFSSKTGNESHRSLVISVLTASSFSLSEENVTRVSASPHH